MTVHLYLGDCLDVMAAMDADSVDSIVTDPPYGLSSGESRQGVSQRVYDALLKIGFPSLYQRYAEAVQGGDLASIPLTGAALRCEHRAVGEQARICVPESAIDLKGNAVVNPEVYHANKAASERIADGALSGEGDAHVGQFLGDFILQLGDMDALGVAGDMGDSGLAEAFFGGFAVPIFTSAAPSLPGLSTDSRVVIVGDYLIGDGHDALCQAACAPCIVTLPRAVNTLMLRFDLRGRPRELLATGRADYLATVGEFGGAQLVRAFPTTGGLASMAQPHRVRFIVPTADGADTHYWLQVWCPPTDDLVTIIPQGGFMGKDWDSSLPDPAVWEAALRVAKPGAHLLAFGSTRTHHRLMCAIEDAGWEIRDTVMWVYSQGFPKGMDVAYVMHQRAEQEAEHDLRFVRTTYLQAPVYACAECGQVLLACMSEQGASQRWRSWAKPQTTGAEQPRVEGWSHLETDARQLCRCPVCTMSHGLLADGSQGRIRDGAPAGYGPALGAATGPARGGTSLESRPVGQSDREPDAVRYERGAQARRGWNVALKPAYEPVIVARKPLIGTVAANVLEYGTGAMNIDACRIKASDLTGQRPSDTLPAGGASWVQDGNLCDSCAEVVAASSKRIAQARRASTAPNNAGQTLSERGETNPADTDRTDTGCCDGRSQAELADDQTDALSLSTSESGGRPTATSPRATAFTISTETDTTTASKTCALCGSEITFGCTDPNMPVTLSGKQSTPDEQGNAVPAGRWPANLIHDGSDEVTELFPQTGESKATPRNNGARKWFSKGADTPYVTYGHNDYGGSAARFFYCAKASKSDRDEGLEEMEERGTAFNDIGFDETKRNRQPRNNTARNFHPTVKPTNLMRYLCRLVTPPGGVVLDPFMGSGSTGKAAALEGFSFVGIELDAEYLEIARRRIEHAQMQPTLDGLG